MTLPFITACVIVRDEAQNLPKWLDSVKIFADEIIVVDTGSADDTKKIAREAGVIVYDLAWQDDFAAAKNFALGKAQGSWIVFPDADETFRAASCSRVRPLLQKLSAGNSYQAVVCPLIDIDADDDGRYMKTINAMRIFRHLPSIRYEGMVHETLLGISAGARYRTSELVIYHTGYSAHLQRAKLERNLQLLEKKARRQGSIAPQDYRYYMDIYYGKKDWENTIRYAKSILADGQSSSETRKYAWETWLSVMVKGGYPVKDTLAKFQAAREAEPDMPRLTLMEGLYRYEKDKQDTKARDLLEAGLAAGKELAAASLDNIARLLPYVYWRLGNIAEDRAELDAAAGYYKQALAARPGFSEGLIALLLVYRQQGQDDTELIEWTKKHYGEKDIVFLATVTESLGGGLYAYWKGEAEHRGWGIAKRLTAIDKMKAFAKHMKPLAKLCEAEEGILAVDKFRYLLQQVEPLPPEAMWLAWNNRVHCCDVLFDTEGAVECQLGQAVNIAGQKAGSQSQAYSNYLFNLHYLESTTDKELREMSFKYNMMYERIVPFQHPLSRHQHQKLRIGYLADRFVENVVSYFGIQLFGIYDRSRFEVYCYSCTSKRDELTKFIEKRVTKMSIPSEERKPSEIAEEIYDDGIDILFDLCGHTAGGITLAVMPYKPAPISISGIGYMSTTGLKSVDYYLGDPYCDPVGLHEDDFSEKLLRVKHSHFCYTPPEKVQRVQKSWHPKNDIIFASFSNLHKVTKHQVAVWAKILQQVPGARMILRSSIPNRYAMRRVREAFVDHGIEPGRLIADVTDIDYFSRYMDVDILLDTYPYVGGGTICDALYVGVPVVSRYGRRHGQRFSHSILENANLGELSVKTDEEYIAKAVALAQDRELLAALHAAIPQMFRNSPVMDAKGYVRDIEEVYEQVFQEWQQEQMQQEAAERQAEHEQQA